MFCPDCGKLFYKKIDFYEHLIYNEGYNEDTINRMINVGLLDEDDVKEMFEMIKVKK